MAASCSRSLLELDAVLTHKQLESAKVVSRFALGLSEKQVSTVSRFSQLYRLVEKKYKTDCPSLLVRILARLGVLERHLFFLREKTLGTNTDLLFSNFPLLDLILTVLYVLDDLPEVTFYAVKVIAMATYFPGSDHSFVKTHVDLIELLLVNGILDIGKSLEYIFAWLESCGCPLYRQYLLRHCVDTQRVPEPNWQPLVASMNKTLEVYGIQIEREERQFCYNWPSYDETLSDCCKLKKPEGKGDLIKFGGLKVSTKGGGGGYSTVCLCFCFIILAIALFIIAGSIFFFYTFVIAKKQPPHI